jgi:hypothetical protein
MTDMETNRALFGIHPFAQGFLYAWIAALCGVIIWLCVR